MAAYNYVNLQGVIIPDTSATKAEVEAEFRGVFGDDVDLSDESPGGALVNSEVIARTGVAVNNANLANQINPNKAGGVYLDALWELTNAITGGRRQATHSTFSQAVNLTGVPGTVIPEGALAVTADGDQFETLSEVTLDVSGMGTAAFRSVETGPIPAAIGALNSIAPGQPLGWETVNNPVAATLGQNQESDSRSRQRRRETLALQGMSTSAAVKSRVAAVNGVRSLSFRENFTNAPVVIDGVNLAAKSVYACVDGGSDSDVATALLESKTAGADWNGLVEVDVVDQDSGQTYAVKLDRPNEIQQWIRVAIKPSNVTDPGVVISTAVLKYVDGEIDGEDGFIVGGDVSPWEMAGAINQDGPGIFIKKIEISDDGITYSLDTREIEIFEVARTDVSKITTVVE